MSLRFSKQRLPIIGEQVCSLVEVNLHLRALGASIGASLAPSDASSGRARLLAYMRHQVGQIVHTDELMIVAGIGDYPEEALRSIPQNHVGPFMRGRSVRPLSDADFTEITTAGLMRSFSALAETALLGAFPPDERVKIVMRALVNRVVRDTSFRASVYEAYDNRCAITGLRILDRTGNSEVHAAHLFAVADGGPDVVQNGLALSGTIHWLFDHHLISLTDDHRLLVAPEALPARMLAIMISPGDKANLPINSALHPHPKYLIRHREVFLALNGRQ